MTGSELEDLAARLGRALLERGLLLVTAESCTGGWIAQAVTARPGSSAWFDRGYVAYSDAAKQEMLGVRAETIAGYGAVSEQTVREMALGALARSAGDVAVAVSGIAGPGGARPGKPVGTVYSAWVRSGGPVRSACARHEGDREAVRRAAVAAALDGVAELVQEPAS